MPRLISDARKQLITRMLGAGMTYRTVCRLTGVSRGAVAQIATTSSAAPKFARPVAEPTLQPPETVPAYKCRCGYLVTLRPCVICQARTARTRKTINRREQASD